METKANPNPRGCLARALPDEPMFVLLARDVCAPTAIRFWADQRAQAAIEEGESQDAEQLLEALETADTMSAWRVEHDGEWRNHKPDPDVVPTPTDDIASLAGRILARRECMFQTGPVNSEKFNTLLADAKRLAGFVLNADPMAGPNHG